MVELRKVTWENYDEVVALKVSEHQRGYVATNLESLAHAYVALSSGEAAAPYGIYADGVLVGFIMYGYFVGEAGSGLPYAGEPFYYLWRFMVDEKYQGKGYGRQALNLALEEIKGKPFGAAKYVSLSYELSNVTGKAFYGSVGFVETGVVVDGEMVAVMEL